MAKFCHKCGSPVIEGSNFCSNCGARLPDTPASNSRSGLINPNLPTVTEYDDSFDKATFDEVMAAAKSGNVAALYEMGSRYRLGVGGTEKDLVKAISLYKKVLKYQNNRAAFYHIGYMLSDGACGEAHTKDCIPYYEAAYALKEDRAALQLGHIYEYGNIASQDLNRALAYYDKAIEFGYDYGYTLTIKARVYKKLEKNDLANMCLQDALKYYDSEIQKGNDAAWCWGEKGDIYQGLDNLLMAKQCYEKALSFGKNPEAATALGTIYEDGIPGKLDADPKKAFQYYKLGYETKHDDGRGDLSIKMLANLLFHEKVGKGQDFLAFRLYNEIRERGSNEGNLYLGYYYGIGIQDHVKADVKLAFELLDDIPDSERSSALYYKGLICLKTLHNEQAAKQFLEASAKMGDNDAIALLRKLSQNNPTPDEIVKRSQELFDANKLDESATVISRGYKSFPDNLNVIRQFVFISQVAFIARAVFGKLESSDKDLCNLLLKLIAKLKDNSFELEGLSEIESNVYYFLGSIYSKEKNYDKALEMFSHSNVDASPDIAYEIFGIHIIDMQRYGNELYNDTMRLRQSLNSRNWHTKPTKALAYLALAMIYAQGVPGITPNLDYAYSCIQECNALAPNVAANELKRFKKGITGKITYTP